MRVRACLSLYHGVELCIYTETPSELYEARGFFTQCLLVLRVY